MKNDSHNFLPDECINGHNLCFINHDILVQLLASGEEQSVFWHRMYFKNIQEKDNFEKSQDLFEWLEKYKKIEDRKQILKTVVFPALLSEFLHFIYESLNTSKKAKLTVSYSLLRKPIQEVLYIFELLLVDIDKFTEQIMTEPEKLYSQSCGGIDIHKKRISNVINILGASDLFDPDYMAQLRYNKSTDDGFDGICNKAIHLFTAHKSIKTEPININFIFSGSDSKLTQWYYLYTRLPYILVYARMVIEKVASTICLTSPEYLDDVERRSSAALLLWETDIKERYMNEYFNKFISSTKNRLFSQCKENGYSIPSLADLRKMRDTGAFPKESRYSIKTRNKEYSKIIKGN